MNTEHDSRFWALPGVYSKAASLAAVGVSLLVLFGWALDNQFFKSVFLGIISMKPNVALTSVLVGVSLL